MNVENLPDSLKPVFERHSCRSFKSEAIPEEHIEILVESMRQAPSAGNRQPWHFYLVHNKDLQHKLADA
ncbi:MAG: nitroreductase family protein, partial [Calditrichia bacterium]